MVRIADHVWGLRSQISHAIVPTTITPQIGRITGVY
jgi:hypothetical protein